MLVSSLLNFRYWELSQKSGSFGVSTLLTKHVSPETVFLQILGQPMVGWLVGWLVGTHFPK